MLYSIISSLFLIAAYGQAPPAGATITAAQPGTTSTPGTPGTTGSQPVAIAAQSVTPAPVTPAPVTPAPVTPAPVTPAPVTTSPGNANPGTVNPGPDVVTPVPPTNPNPNPNPSTPQQPPVTPQQPPATPQYGYPQQQYNPYGQPGFGGIMPGLMDPQVLTCEFGQCRNRRITMSPGQGFKLECNMLRQCDGLDLTLNVGVDPTSFGSQVNEINDFIFDAPQSGVKITINNPMMQNIEVNNILCKRAMSCQNMQIRAGFGVELWEVNVKCEMPGACTGCTINGQSCEMISMMQGHGHGGVAPGFGYMNQPNVPQTGFGGAPAPQTGFGAPAPQQPGAGAPGQSAPQQGAPQYPQYQQPQPYYPPYPQYGYPYGQPQFYPMYNPWI